MEDKEKSSVRIAGAVKAFGGAMTTFLVAENALAEAQANYRTAKDEAGKAKKEMELLLEKGGLYVG